MIIHKESIEINASPERVFEELVHLLKDRDTYRAWHVDHINLCWIKGEPFSEGAILYTEEYIKGEPHQFIFRIREIIPNRVIKYGPLFPASLLWSVNSLRVVPNGESGSIFTTMGSIRLPWWLIKRLNKKYQNRIEIAKHHMKLKGENLKQLLEYEETGEEVKVVNFG